MVSANTPYHVLLIEEDPKQAEVYAELIREVAECKIDVISRVSGSFDWIGGSNYHLVVIDHGGASGGLPGFSLLEQIKRISPVTSVILMSDRATIEQAVAAIRMGAEDYLRKPFNLEAFQLAIKRGLDRKAVFGDNTAISNFMNLLNCCQMISASLDQKRIFNLVLSYFTRELRSAHSAIYALDSGKVIKVDTKTKEDREHDKAESPNKAIQEVLDISIQATNPLPALEAGNEIYRFIDKSQLSPGLFIFRFKSAAGLDHYLVCLSPERPAAMEAFDSRVRMLKTQIEVTTKNIAAYMGFHRLVYVDDATGLYNTRYLNYILDREITNAQKEDGHFAVLFIDADYFKKVNDNHGHLVGTKILNELGVRIRKFVRETDSVFRYGGDEFVAVLSPCDLPTATTVAERIRTAIEQEPFLESDGLNLNITISIGVALFPDHAKSKQEIINAADHAMYSAKRSTRNAVTIAEVVGAQKTLTAPASPKPTQKSPEGTAHRRSPRRKEARNG